MSNLTFQEPAVPVPLRFKSFYGRNIDQMPLLRSGKDEGGKEVDVPRFLITPKQVLYERVHGKNENDRTLLRDNYVDTALAVLADPDGSGEVRLARYTQPVAKELMDSLNPKSTLQNGSLVVNRDQYRAVSGDGVLTLSADVANDLRQDGYRQPKERRKAWEFFTEGDSKLVDDHLKLVQEARKGDFSNRMGLFLPSQSGMRLLCLGSVGDSNYGLAYGNLNLDSNLGRLVGVVAPEALVAKNMGSLLERTVADALQTSKPFEFNGTVYVPAKGVSLQEQ